MYFSATELFRQRQSNGTGVHDHIILRSLPRNYGRAAHRPLTLKDYRAALKSVKTALVNRQSYGPNGEQLSKWYRPWDMVPELTNFRAPEGDFGVGFEVELGFTSLTAARRVANHVKNWKHITLDFEGGSNPIELTFPPTCYSKLGKGSQVVRYLDYLTANSNLVTRHLPGGTAGTHINVSLGGGRRIRQDRVDQAVQFMSQLISSSTTSYDYALGRYVTTPPSPEGESRKERWFGRHPYGWGYAQAGGKWVEWKLFHSTTDSDRLRQYADIAVSITKLIGSTDAITRESVLAAMEAGYAKGQKRIDKKNKDDGRENGLIEASAASMARAA